MSNKKPQEVRHAHEQNPKAERPGSESEAIDDAVVTGCCDGGRFMEAKILCLAEMVLDLSKVVQCLLERSRPGCGGASDGGVRLCGLLGCCKSKKQAKKA